MKCAASLLTCECCFEYTAIGIQFKTFAVYLAANIMGTSGIDCNVQFIV